MQDPSSPLRLFVDKERNTVVVAEATADFVDALFSFLTLPLGTIIRLLSHNQTNQSVDIGCINNLYQSVQNSSTQAFWNEICKQMLLCPRNPCEKLCQKLRFNVDDTKPTKYLMCGSCRGGFVKLLSTFAGVSCSCGKLMQKEMKLPGEEDNSKGDGVFVRGGSMYLIFDDLRVLPNSAGNTVHQLLQLGYTDSTKLSLMCPNVGLTQIMDLLKRALISKSPLTDVFLALDDDGSKPMSSFTPKLPPNKDEGGCSIDLQIIVSKSKNKVVYCEAKSEFSDFLFSFLTLPLGCVLKLLDGNVTLGSMDNLYKSVKSLCPSWFRSGSNSSFTSTSTPLLDLKVAHQYGCMKQPLKLREEETPNYCYIHNTGVIQTYYNYGDDRTSIQFFEPRCADGRKEAAVGFVRRPAFFAVMDDLEVTPLTSTSSVLFLQKLNIPLNDLEQYEVKIGITEALNLLGASLTSKAALTNGFSYLVKKPKEETIVSAKKRKEETTA